MTLNDLITEAEDVADKAIHAEVGPFQWQMVKQEIHPVTERMVRDAVSRAKTEVLPYVQELLTHRDLYSPGLASWLDSISGVLTDPSLS